MRGWTRVAARRGFATLGGMQPSAWTFTEKNFYLAEFRGRSLAVALPEAEPASLALLEEVLGELARAGTRVVLLVPPGSRLGEIVGCEVQRLLEPGWVGLLWRRIRRNPITALELAADDFRAHCRQAALRLRLAKLVWIDRHGGLRTPDGRRLSVVDLADLERLIETRAAQVTAAGDERLALLGEIRRMLAGGLPAVNLCSLEGLADELFTYAGSGTFFTRERYAQVRQLALDDFDAAADLIARGVEEGYLLGRTPEEIEAVLGHGFGVFIEGRYLAGIGSLLPYPDRRAGEIAALYTLTRFLGEGVGADLIDHATGCAERAGYRYVFACTTSERVQRFFERHRFRRVPPDDVPPEKWPGYAPERREAVRCLRYDVPARSSPR